MPLKFCPTHAIPNRISQILILFPFITLSCPCHLFPTILSNKRPLSPSSTSPIILDNPPTLGWYVFTIVHKANSSCHFILTAKLRFPQHQTDQSPALLAVLLSIQIDINQSQQISFLLGNFLPVGRTTNCFHVSPLPFFAHFRLDRSTSQNKKRLTVKSANPTLYTQSHGKKKQVKLH